MIEKHEYTHNCTSCGKIITHQQQYEISGKKRKTRLCAACRNSGVTGPHIIGNRYGKLEVTEYREDIQEYVCRCECGGELRVKLSQVEDLKGVNIRTCGCSPLKPKPWKRIRPYESLYHKVIQFAVRRGHSVALTYEQFLTYTKSESCYYCDTPVMWNPHGMIHGAATNLDRKDSNLGYSVKNCVVCCIQCNRMKSHWFTCEEFIVAMKAVNELRASKRLASTGPLREAA